MSQRQPTRDPSGTGRRRPTTTRQQSDTYIDFTEFEDGELMPRTAIREPPEAAWQDTRSGMNGIVSGENRDRKKEFLTLSVGSRLSANTACQQP